jgi:hypothetical protein
LLKFGTRKDLSHLTTSVPGWKTFSRKDGGIVFKTFWARRWLSIGQCGVMVVAAADYYEHEH